MKKFLSILLCTALILGLAACGSKQPETEAPTEAPKTTEAPQTTEAPTVKPTDTPAETTAAPTQPPVTEPAPTEPPVTEPAPTEPAPTEPPVTEPAPTEPPVTEPAPTDPVSGLDPNAKPEEVFQAMIENVANIVRAIRHQEAEPVQLSLSASGEGKLTLSFDLNGQIEELVLAADGRAEGIVDTEKGIHIAAEYSENLSSLIVMFMGGEAETNTEKIEYYVDFENSRSYQMTESEGQWYYSDVEIYDDTPVETGEADINLIYQEYTFGIEGDYYVFEGPLNIAGLSGQTGEAASETMSSLPLDALTVNFKLMIDGQMRLCAIIFEAAETSLNLGEALTEGVAGALNTLKGEILVSYEPVEYVLPEEVKENAIDISEYDPYDDNGHAWSNNKFVTDNEVLVDNDVLTMTAVSVEDSWLGLNLNLRVENKADYKIALDFKAVSVNGYSCDIFEYETVEKNETSEFTVQLDEDDLNLIGVKSIDEVRILFSVSNNDKYETIGQESAVFYPTGLTAEEIVYPERKSNPRENVIVDNDDVLIIFIQGEKDPYFGYELLSYVENRSDKNLALRFENVTINDIEYTTYWSNDIMSGFKGYFTDYFSIDTIEVSEVTKITASLEISDDDDFWADPIATLGIIYEP